jgi:hypothetical protein
VNIRLGGLVETVFTLRTHFFFVIWPSQESPHGPTWRLGRDWHSLDCFAARRADDALTISTTIMTMVRTKTSETPGKLSRPPVLWAQTDRTLIRTRATCLFERFAKRQA